MKSKHLSLCAAVIIFLLAACTPETSVPQLEGLVLTEAGEPLPGAVVRVRASDLHTLSDEQGRFILPQAEAAFVTAWVEGYYIHGVEANPREATEIHLEAHTTEDNPDYEWLPSTYQPGEGEDQGCAECHSNENTNLDFTLPVDEWLQDAHAQSALNHRFLTMYTGQDVDGNQSPQTRYGYSRDYGSFPLRPDLDEPYYGPGYKLDFPDTAGNCAACHTPLTAVDAAYDVDPTALSGISLEGISCDFCHKVWDVRLDPASGLPGANMPGVLSFEFRRPPEDHQLFIGPLDDVAPGEDTYSALQTQSQFCAPCHFGVFWDTVIYNSFGEWLESPYSDPERAKTAGLSSSKTCQDCHMPPLGNTHFVLPEAGGLERDPSTIFSHKMPGAADNELLQNALTMKVNAHQAEDKVVVEVELINDKTGHHIPTDSPLRHLILLVQARDEGGSLLEQVDGQTVPEWGGVGDYAEGYYAGAPGTAYAKVLMELWTEVSPTGAYWNPTRIVSDNRIPAMESDITNYIFKTSKVSETFEVSVRLLFRRAYIELMDQKGWDDPDILMEEEVVELP